MKTILAASAAVALLGLANVATPASAAFVPEGATLPTASTTNGVMLAHGRHTACRAYGGWHEHYWDGYYWRQRYCNPPYSGGGYHGGGGGYGGGY